MSTNVRTAGRASSGARRLMVQAGRQCQQFLADTMQDVCAADIQCDEIWSYVGCKERTAFFQSAGEGVGDAYVFTAIDRYSKLLVCFHVGRRTAEDAVRFSEKLAACVGTDRPHVSTDGFKPYHTTIPDAFGHNVDHGMLVKQYGSPSAKEQRRYSPATIISAKEYQNADTSGKGQICTSHVERSNLTVRMQNRRFTRLTNAFSKKWENHELMFALFACWYNFVRPHMTLKTTPAVAAGLASGAWTVERLLSETANALIG